MEASTPMTHTCTPSVARETVVLYSSCLFLCIPHAFVVVLVQTGKTNIDALLCMEEGAENGHVLSPNEATRERYSVHRGSGGACVLCSIDVSSVLATASYSPCFCHGCI